FGRCVRGVPFGAHLSQGGGVTGLRVAEGGPDRLDPLSIDTEIRVAEPRGRAHLDRLPIAVELDVVDEAHERRRELHVEVVGPALNDLGARYRRDDARELLHGDDGVTAEGEGADPVLAIVGLAVHAVGRARTGRELAVLDTEVRGPLAAELENA